MINNLSANKTMDNQHLRLNAYGYVYLTLNDVETHLQNGWVFDKLTYKH